MTDVRQLAFRSLMSCEVNARYTNLELNTVISRTTLTPHERAFYTALLYGVTERRRTLDYQIYKLYKRPIDKLSVEVATLLRLGLYQLIYMNSIPEHAAVASTVDMAKTCLNPGACGLINAILRQAQRELRRDDGSYGLITPDKSRDICGHLSITYSVPRYLCKTWCRAYGAERAEEMMMALGAPASTVLRVNTLKTTREALMAELETNGIKASPSALTDDGIILSDGCAVSELDALADGRCFVQDDASALCVSALEPRPGETVMDLCAAPGGKSFGCAIAMRNEGRLLSFDVHDSKLSLIRDGAKRLGIDILSAECADASLPRTELFGLADRVLCDVPCSGFGTIAKKPDLRNKSAESIRDLPSLQLKILENGARYVKKGGILVYSTCTLMPSENEDNISAFFALHPEHELLSRQTLFPGNGTDGFFIAKLRIN